MEASQPGRILLIDDDPALGGYLTRVLTRGGFEVTHELDSASALLRVEEQDWDLLITDIELPGMNGLELLERVRQLVPSLPVAVLTGNPTVDYAVSALRSAAAEFLQKPIGAGDLITKAAELIRAGREARARGREIVLAIGAHPDDVEIGAAGTLLAHRAAGDTVAILTLSRGARGGDQAQRAPVLEDIGQVQVAAQQAGRLTRQLLTFARHEVRRPEIIDLNEVVRGAGELLRRTLGEHIELTTDAEPALWRVKADRGQLDQVLVNLAVNARDAMPGGGRLTIDTANAEVDETYASTRPALVPGRYARLRVSDTGTGMDQATAERVFEPFFSTKPRGRGTGLGLATVYGIVTSAGGSIEIYSEPGLGTTVSVLLPVTDEDAAVAATAPASADDLEPGHGETILVVEDEASLRELTSRILTRSGYQVCVVASGPEAVRRASDPDQPIDLLLTDVVMPEMLGNEVAARVDELRPGVPALFMSGYAQPILDTHGIPSPHYDILEKPFTEAALLTRVRRALTRPAPAPAASPSPNPSLPQP
jgi:signal transduction histidine kinase